MSKLTDTQLIVLSAAAARDDGVASVPKKMNKAAAIKVGASLLARKLMREVRAKPDAPVWREDEENRAIALVITAAGRKAIGVEDDVDEESAGPAKGAKNSPSRQKNQTTKVIDEAAEQPRGKKAASAAIVPPSPEGTVPRAGSKQALVIDMLSAKSGTTIDALIDATGWLPHTTRAALTGLRKRGFAIERAKGEGGTSFYRIVQAEARADATSGANVKARSSKKAEMRAAA